MCAVIWNARKYRYAAIQGKKAGGEIINSGAAKAPDSQFPVDKAQKLAETDNDAE